AKGNHGWSVLVEDEGLATALQSVFEIDFDERRRDSVPERIGSVPGVSASPPLPPRTLETRSDNRRARLVVGPDANLDPDGILDLLLSATERLSIETFYIEDPLALLGLYVLVAVASAVSLRKLRPGDKGIKPRPRVRTRALIRAPLRRRRGEVRLLPPELVAEPRARDGGGTGARGGREET